MGARSASWGTLVAQKGWEDVPDEYKGRDTVLVADVPYEAHPCNELAPEFQPGAPPR